MKEITFLAVVAFAATAAAAPPGTRPDPMDPQARVPAIQYRSAFERYRAHNDPPVADWRETNERVGTLGGHAGHLARPGATSGPAGKPDAKASTPEQPRPDGHRGHHR